MLTAQLAATATESEEEITKVITTAVEREVKTEVTTEFVIPSVPEGVRTEAVTGIKSQVNKVGSIVYITRLVSISLLSSNSHTLFPLSPQPQQNTNSSSARQQRRHPSHLFPSTSPSTSTL